MKTFLRTLALPIQPLHRLPGLIDRLGHALFRLVRSNPSMGRQDHGSILSMEGLWLTLQAVPVRVGEGRTPSRSPLHRTRHRSYGPLSGRF